MMSRDTIENESNNLIIVVVILVVVILSSFWMARVCMQNRMNELGSQSHNIKVKYQNLQREVLLQKLEINKLSSIENLSDFAKKSGLGLNGVPTKVRVIGGNP